MQRILTSLVQLSACFMLMLAASAQAADAKKADPSGTWTWSFTGQNGQTRETTMKLKKDGDKYTGTISGRNGNDTPIEDVKVSGDDISFKVVREFNGNKMTSTYTGKISGDTIKGKSEFTTRDGENRSRDWEAKRSGSGSSSSSSSSSSSK